MGTIKDGGVQLVWKLHFHAHLDYIFSQYVRMLGLIQTITSSISTLVNLLIFYITLVDPCLSMPYLYGILYCLLTPKTWNTFCRSL